MTVAGSPVVAGKPAEAEGLEVNGLAIGYGDLVVARDLEFAIRPGEVVALLGANGVGKTTTLLTLAGEIPALAGSVRWGSDELRGSLAARAHVGVGFVPEDRGVISGLTVAENMRLGPGTQEDALALFPELEPHLRRHAGLLSGGQQKMLSLALALAGHPKLLLTDELSLGLAPQLVARLLRAVRAGADAGAGVLLVEQHARQALEVSDRGMVLGNGRIQFAGASSWLLDRLEGIQQSYLSSGGPDLEKNRPTTGGNANADGG